MKTISRFVSNFIHSEFNVSKVFSSSHFGLENECLRINTFESKTATATCHRYIQATVCQKGVKNKKNCLGMTPIFFESLYPQASKKSRKKIFGVQNLDFSTF